MSTGSPPAGGNGGWGTPPAGGNGGWGTPPAGNNGGWGSPSAGNNGGWGGSTPPAGPTGGAGGWGGSTPPAGPTGGAGGWGGSTPPAGPTGGAGGWGGSTPPAGPTGGAGGWGGSTPPTGGGNDGGGWGGAPSGGNNGGWNAPAGSPTPPKSGGGCLKVAIGLVVLGLLGVGALVAIGLSLPSKGDAELVSVVVENRTLADGTPQAVMVVTLTATEAPEDPALLTSNLVLTGTSSAFSSDVVVSWDQLAEADKDPATVAGTPPVIGTPYIFEHVIEGNLMTNITTYSEGVSMSLKLEWNDYNMDSDSISITHLYEFN